MDSFDTMNETDVLISLKEKRDFMTFQFVIGRADFKHGDYLLDEITHTLRENKMGPEVLLLVPDQMTFQQESALFNEDRVSGSIRAQVSSFSRLAWRVLQEKGGSTRKFISSIGIQMALRKIIEEQTGEWHVFQKALEKQGFLVQLESMINEFKRHDISPDMLQEQILEIGAFVHNSKQELALNDKLRDLSYIYEKLTQTLQNKYMDGEDQLDLLIDKIYTTDFFDDSEIFIDGFYRFTPKELRVVEALMTKSKRITMSLIVDPDEVGDEFTIDELDLFYQTKETYLTLKELSQKANISFLSPVQPDEAYRQYDIDSPLKPIEEHFSTRPTPQSSIIPPITVAEAVHPRAEVEGVAQAILKLVRKGDTRFRDIAIFIRDGGVYHDVIQTIFSDYDIPVFVDEKKPMLHHSLVELIRSLLDTIESDWRADSLFRLLKTGFIKPKDEEFPLTLDAIDRLENYVLEYGIRSKKNWLLEEDWKFQRFTGFEEGVQTNEDLEWQREINAYRRQVAATLVQIDESVKEAKTVFEYSEAIYSFLDELEVPGQLETLQYVFEERGELEASLEQEQAWNAVVQLFDEIVEIAGSEKLSFTIYRSILETGFESLEFAHVPPALDQVIVGTVDQSRIGTKKHTFLLGVNEGMWPLKPDGDRVVSEEERELLANYGLRLADTSSRQLLDDLFYMYIGFTTGSESLWVSYPISDEEGRSKVPSQWINRLYEMYPNLSAHYLLRDPDELYDASRFITTKSKTRSALTVQLARSERGYPLHPIWNSVLNWYMHNDSKNSTTYDVLQSLDYRNEPGSLQEETVTDLYGKKLSTSVSRLEMYHRCSYQHFVQYGLRLQERKTYKLDAPDIGQLFHEALKQITEWVQKEQGHFGELTKESASGYANRAVKKLGPVLQNKILQSSARYRYIQEKLEEIIARATFILSEQARHSDFTPVGLEMRFGENEELGPIQVPLRDGFELILRGQIDRIDEYRKDDQLYLRIIDYKSSQQRLSLLEVYYGLSLQMLTYLEVVLAQSEKWLGLQASPAGVLYFHVHNPLLSKQEKIEENTIDREYFKEYKMQGLLNDNPEIITSMDTSLESGWSDIVSLGLSKQGKTYKNSQVASDTDFELLKSHIYKIMEHAGLEIITGQIKLNPYKSKQQSACTFCSFSSVCQFDPVLKTNSFERLVQMNDEEVLEHLSKESGDETDEMD